MMLFCFSPLPNPMQIALFCPFDWPKYLLLPVLSPNADRPLEKVLSLQHPKVNGFCWLTPFSPIYYLVFSFNLFFSLLRSPAAGTVGILAFGSKITWEYSSNFSAQHNISL
jgi:hypothetical protein